MHSNSQVENFSHMYEQVKKTEQTSDGVKMRGRMMKTLGARNLRIQWWTDLWFQSQMVRWLVTQYFGIASAVRPVVARPGGTIAMHVRRGDACNRFVSQPDSWANGWDTKKGRPCFPLEMYVAAARKMQTLYGYSRIALITDSDSVIRETNRYADFDWSFIHFNRSYQFGGENVALNCTTFGCATQFFIENRKDVEYSTLIDSVMEDLNLIKDATCLIGTSLATFTHVALMLIWGSHGVFPPFIFVDRPMCVSTDRRGYRKSCSEPALFKPG